MEKFKVRIKDTDRKFVRVYQDFLYNTVLTSSEKMVYIALKSFVDFSYDGGQVFPSMETLCKLTSLKERTVRDTINSLIKKGIVQKKRRGLSKTNIYTLSDNSEIWSSKTPEELKESAKKEGITLSTEELLAELQRRGAIEILEKEKDSTPETDQSTGAEPKNKQFSVVNNTNNSTGSQEQYTLDFLKKKIEYDLLKERYPTNDLVDSILMLMYERLNTAKDTIRVSGEDKPASVVKSMLLKVGLEEVEHTINQYEKVTDRVKQTESYLFAILYKSPIQKGSEFTNYFNRTYYGNSED